jgi:hypothetical protein
MTSTKEKNAKVDKFELDTHFSVTCPEEKGAPWRIQVLNEFCIPASAIDEEATRVAGHLIFKACQSEEKVLAGQSEDDATPPIQPRPSRAGKIRLH